MEDKNYDEMKKQFVKDVYTAFAETQTEVADRNSKIQERDGYIYGDYLERSIDIPLGHDKTMVNWLRRTVEIHKNMFMSRGFQMVSTYDLKDVSSTRNPEDMERLEIENKKAKEYAEARQQAIEAIKRDNGGEAFWAKLAENASAVGDSVVKSYYDKEKKKYIISPVESVENIYVLWDKNDFRQKQAVAYVYQITLQKAMDKYGAPKTTPISDLGKPFSLVGWNNQSAHLSSQKMVTVIDVVGKIPKWSSVGGRCKAVKEGEETEVGATIVGGELYKFKDKNLPKYYILPNKQHRQRPWGVSDVSDAAIALNQTYVETLSDWRTHASKINFQKFKAFNFADDTQMPKYKSRRIQILPLGEGQDIVRLDQGDANGLDFRQQMEELKEQFVRETGISRVLFDDPSVTLNSNQALLTSMKPTSDIAEAKKQLWTPILIDIFIDALETIAEHEDDYKELLQEDSNWSLKVMWPSVMQKEDPVYQQMLINRFNAGTMSLQSFVEAQGETKEEIDRIRQELLDPVTSAILGRQIPLIAQTIVNAATADIQAWYQAMVQPQEQPQQQGVGQTATVAQNQEGQGVMSQPGSGATTASPQGAIDQLNQNAGL